MEEMEKELDTQFKEFLHTKGIRTKFKLAFENMKESAAEQHKKDRENFAEVRQKSYEENKEFVDMLHTKGFKAKVKVIIEGFKKSARESKQKTKEAVEQSKKVSTCKEISAEGLSAEFNLFLKERGLDSKYTVRVIEE